MPARFLIDVNLPRDFAFWNSPEFIHQSDIDPVRTDREIWLDARTRGVVIVTKDADFSQRVLVQGPPPAVIYVRLGNMRLRELRSRLAVAWPKAAQLSETHCLVQVFHDRIEAVR
jgi:predicted nuclease of predicted toxin-antitoxin system